MTKKVGLLVILIAGIGIAFQNCADEVSFHRDNSMVNAGVDQLSGAGETDDSGAGGDGTKSPNQQTIIDRNSPNIGGGGLNNGGSPRPPSRVVVDRVCNPLDPSANCDDAPMGQGLLGRLYYMTPQIHGSRFSNDLNNALIDDYRNYGVQVPVDIVMSSVNVTPRSWEDGFVLPSGNLVKKEDGKTLFEWFHLDMAGFISLPAGAYQFATLSDDGMRVTVNNEVILNHDGVHSPSYRCAEDIIEFEKDEKKHIRVQYFQGPRTRIAMQLLVRPASRSQSDCGENGQLEVIPPGSFSHN